MLHSIEEPAPASAAPQWRAFLELGFRPLYLLGCTWALVSILLWVYMPRMLSAPLGGVFWHAHEMLWGFIITIAVGFLFTAGNNWTGINPLKGRALGWACVLWIVARVAYLLPHDAAFWVGVAAETAFFGWATVVLASAIYRAKSKRNYGVPLLVLAMGAANLLFLLSIWEGEYDDIMRYFRTGMVGMAVVALLVARRVIPFFAMRAVSGLEIPMHLESGRWQLSAGGAAILFTALDLQLAAAVCLALSGVIALWQLLSWKPQAVLHKPILWILYAGYAGMGLGLVVAAIWAAGWIARPVWFVHIIGVAGFSVLIIGMVTRTALGHLGRPLQTDGSMVFCYWALIVSAVLRMLALAAEPPFTTPLLHTSGLAWMLCFGVYLWRFIPMLIRPRIDEMPGTGKHRVIRPNVPLKTQAPK
ncbi:MAG: NnrS family protein [Lautropia sp.]|nr:NnrS family protein [Lautropia sp.]